MMSKLRWWSQGTLAIACVLALYVLLSVKRNEVKPLWFDELGTLNVATQPTLAGMLRVEPADGNPPLQYLLVRPSLRAFGVSALPLRLPAMAGVGLALVCAYVFVGRRFGAAAALVVPTMLLISRVSDYGVEARPYGLLMGLIALMLVLWQRAAEPGVSRRGPVLAGLAMTVFALVIAQPMGLLWAGVPLFAGEAWRAYRTRRLDKAMLLAIVLGLSGFAITLHFGHATQQVLSANAGRNHSAIALPTLGKLKEALLVEGLPPALALLVLGGGLALFLRRRQAQRTGVAEHGAPAHEWIAVGALTLTIFVVYLFTAAVTHYFWARYIVPGVFGGFLLAGMACGYAGGGKQSSAAAVLALGLCLIWVERRGMVSTTASAPAQDSIAPTLLAREAGRSSEPIVIGKPFFYPETWWYGSPALRARLHYIADAPHAAETTDFIAEMTLLAMHQAGSPLFPPDKLAPFLAQHRKFLLWHRSVVQGCWLEDYLHAQGYTFAPVASDSSGNETLYEVSAPAAAF